MIVDRNFIIRSLKTALIVTIIFAPFVQLYFGTYFTLGFITGSVWNIVNVFLLFKVSNVLVPSNESKKTWGLASDMLKFPVLFGAGYLVIKYTRVSLYGIMIGFSLLLIVFILRAVGGYLTGGVSLERSKGYGRGA